MLACPSCDAVNPEDFRFCGQCGAALAVLSCPSCGRTSPAGLPFCGHCGAALGAEHAGTRPTAVASDGPLEERKLATVLFADVVGFTTLAERTDAEVVARMVDGAFRELGRVVAEHGGTVDKYMGDSLMAVFGVPVAHDDDAERAVAAALAMRHVGGDLVFSIGVNSGEVMATAVGRGDVTVIGDAVNVAARLEKAAGPGEVLCGRLTAELARQRIEFSERSPVLLKGKSEPVEVFEALRLRRRSGHAAEAPPLVGRDDELAFLDMQWRRVREDTVAKLVVVCGEAGSGKSRLLDELASIVGDRATVVRSAYPAYGTFGGMSVAAEMVEQLGHSEDPDVEARVRSVLGDIGDSLGAMDPDSLHQEQIWGLGRLLRERSEQRPLVIMIDDLHWGDEQTLVLVGEVARRMRDVPILTVIAGRTDPGDWLGRFTAATTLRLQPLPSVHAAALARGLVGRPLAEDAGRFLVEMANGNPLYLRELVSMAKVKNMLVEEDGEVRLTAHAGIPATLQALLAARLDALDRAQKVVLQHASLLGEGREDELAGLAGRDVSGDLAALVDSGLLRSGPDHRYTPADPLLGEVAYDMLPRTMRGELHRRAAGVVHRPEDRVRHLERATEYEPDDPTLAAEAAEALADQARGLLRASRFRDAMTMFERAVELGLRRPDALLELARLQANCNKEKEALAVLSFIPDDPDNPRQAVERDHTAANVMAFVDPLASLPKLYAAVEQWHALGDKSKEAWAHANAGVAHFNVSQMRESARALERGLTLFEEIGDNAGAVAASSFLCLARPGDPRVDQWLADALRFAAETGDRGRQMTTLLTLTWKSFFQCFGGGPADTASAEGFARQLADLAEELDAADLAMHGLSLLALLARLTGRLDDAVATVARLQRAIAGGRVRDAWLAWATSFSVTVAGGERDAAPPFPPEDNLDPVVAMAWLVVDIELILAGRVDEVLERRARTGPVHIEGPMADVGGLVYALAMLLGGRGADAPQWIASGADAMAVIHGKPGGMVAAALAYEAGMQGASLPPLPATVHGMADALVVRLHAMAGNAEAAAMLRNAAKALAAPGLLVGIS